MAQFDRRDWFKMIGLGLGAAALRPSLAQTARAGIDIGRSFPPYDRWARISIGLPPENALARTAVRKLLTVSANTSTPENKTATCGVRCRG